MGILLKPGLLLIFIMVLLPQLISIQVVLNQDQAGCHDGRVVYLADDGQEIGYQVERIEDIDQRNDNGGNGAKGILRNAPER